MRRVLSLACGFVLVALCATASAPAATLSEVGATPKRDKPSCPDFPCLAFTRASGYQAKVRKQSKLMRVRRDGRLVAYTLDLGKVGPTQIKFFNSRYGSPAQVQLTIFRPGKKLFSRVIRQGPIVRLEKYFGRRVTFALTRSVVVHKNEVVGLTTQTWAPLIATGLGAETSWRGSRRRGKCNDEAEPQRQNALGLNMLFQFRCLYKARLTYSATVVPRP